MTLALIAYHLSSIVLWGSLLTFGVWAYQKFQFRSLPWLAAFLVLSLVLTFVEKFAYWHIQDNPPSRMPALLEYLSNGDTLGNTFSWLSYWGAFASNLTYLILATLVFADLVVLLANSGIDIQGKFGGRLIQIRQRSTVLGIAMLLFKIVPSLGILMLSCG